MKTTKAPKKIYLKPLLTEDGGNIVRRCTLERLMDSQIEYTQTDVIIEKACEYIITHVSDMHTLGVSAKMDERIIKELKDYMKG